MLALVPWLHWWDVDPTSPSLPTLLDFDPAPARRIAEELILRAEENKRKDDNVRQRLEASLELALLAEYGSWVAGWDWGASEPGNGGPIRGWCCSRDSLLRKDDPGPAASVDRVVAALHEWRTFLCDLAAQFAQLRRVTEGMPIEEAVAHAAAQLLPTVLERSSAVDAWYATFARVLCWYLQSAGHDDEAIAKSVAEITAGRFESWIEPDQETRQAAAVELGHAVGRALAGPPRDGLDAWLAIRGKAFANPLHGDKPIPVRGDGHLRYVDGRERARDPDRAERMATALAECRASASRGEPLTFARLSSWQAVVLGQAEVGFRTGTAYAKKGREKYHWADGIEERFARALEEANGQDAVAVRAARAYLDVCFFHPFPDGNARAARLALDHVLTGAGRALHTAEPLFLLTRAPGSATDAWCFARVVEMLSGPLSPAGR